MKSEKYSNAYAEVLHYLKGVSKQSLNRIPTKLLKHFEKHKNKDYICDFDYTKSLKDLQLWYTRKKTNIFESNKRKWNKISGKIKTKI